MMEKAAIDGFLADPAGYFNYSLTRMMTITRKDFDELQLTGLKRRFEQLRHSIPMLEKLADRQGVTEINNVHDVIPLLFDHATYKSYPASLLEKKQFKQLTGWLNKLTSHDLSGIDVSHCQSVDDWLLTLYARSPLAVFHTSSSSGTMSFLPWTKAEMEKFVQQYLVVIFQAFGKESAYEAPPVNIDCIFPYFRSGSMSFTQLNDAVVNVIAGSEERFHALYPGRLSAEMLYFAAKLRAAKAKGQLDRLEITPELIARSDEFETLQQDMGQQSKIFLSAICTQLKGRRVFMNCTDNLLYSMAASGLAQGNSKVFSPDSVVMTGGGGKGGIVLPDDWRETVQEFFGTDHISNNYGMSEGGMLPQCAHGHYHVLPDTIPFVLDPETSEPLPRQGRVTGRFAFYILQPDTRWGGFITGDEVTMEWDSPCACGRTTPYLLTVQRYSNKTGGDDKITCGGQAGAYDEAINFLNEMRHEIKE